MKKTASLEESVSNTDSLDSTLRKKGLEEEDLDESAHDPNSPLKAKASTIASGGQTIASDGQTIIASDGQTIIASGGQTIASDGQTIIASGGQTIASDRQTIIDSDGSAHDPNSPPTAASGGQTIIGAGGQALDSGRSSKDLVADAHDLASDAQTLVSSTEAPGHGDSFTITKASKDSEQGKSILEQLQDFKKQRAVKTFKLLDESVEEKEAANTFDTKQATLSSQMQEQDKAEGYKQIKDNEAKFFKELAATIENHPGTKPLTWEAKDGQQTSSVAGFKLETQTKDGVTFRSMKPPETIEETGSVTMSLGLSDEKGEPIGGSSKLVLHYEDGKLKEIVAPAPVELSDKPDGPVKVKLADGKEAYLPVDTQTFMKLHKQKGIEIQKAKGLDHGDQVITNTSPTIKQTLDPRTWSASQKVERIPTGGATSPNSSRATQLSATHNKQNSMNK